MKYLQLASSLLAVLLLNGCLEVEDNNSEANSLITEAESTVNIKGVVVNALDASPMDDALITVKVGSTEIQSNIIVSNGDFEIQGLPEYSDIDIIISSPDNKFLPRTFFQQTSKGNTNGMTDYGSFPVSESITVDISVIDGTTSSAFTGLEFIGHSHSGTNSSAYKYQHVSTFNAETGIYSITLPKFINSNIRANLDFDKDGNADFIPEISYRLNDKYLYLRAVNTAEFTEVYLNPAERNATDLEVRLSLVNEESVPLLGALFFVEDTMIDSIYDEVTQQYVINTEIKNFISIQVPSFSSNDVNYQGNAITITKLDDGNLSIKKEGNYYNGGYNNCCFVIPSNTVIDLALSPQVNFESETPLEVVLAAPSVSSTDSSYSVFYSQAIEVEPTNIALTHRYGFSVVKGSDDANDLILPGTTVVTGNLSIPVTYELSLHDTRLTVTPVEPLVAGESYIYDIGTITTKVNQETINLNNDALSFKIKTDESTSFDLNSMKLDNENYTTNGVNITPSNTAGDIITESNSRRSVYLYLPKSINSLQNFSLRQVSVIENGISSVNISNYNVVSDGEINVYSVGVVRLASNENYQRENLNTSIVVSSAQPETQKVYRLRIDAYLSDNTNAEINTVSFEYAYETLLGEIATGTVTLPVE